MRRLLLLGTAAALLCPPFASSAGLSWRAEREPFRLVYESSGHVLTEQAGPGVPGPTTRLSYELPDGRWHTLTGLVSERATDGGTEYVVATTEPSRHARVSVTRTPRGLRVETVLDPDPVAVRFTEAFRAAPNEWFLGTGERGIVDLSEKAVQLKVSHPCRNYALTPFYFSSAGYGIYVDTAALGVLAFRAPFASAKYPCDSWGVPSPTLATPEVIQLAFNAPSLAYEVYAGSPGQLLEAYTAKVGRPPLPPPAQFALVKWRDEISSFSEIREDVTRLQEAGMPLGSVILDNPWEVGRCNGALAFGTEFGDVDELFAFLAERDVGLMVWISPLVSKRCGMQGYPEEGLISADDRHWVVDFTHLGAVQVFKDKLGRLLEWPIVGVKADRGDEVFLPAAGVRAGDPGSEHNLYAYRFAKAVSEVLQERRGPRHTSIFRAGFAGSNAFVQGIWAGDQLQTWDGLGQALRMGLSAAVSGFPIWGSDVGGYMNEPEDPPLTSELFLRWAQLGSISPVLEVGGAGQNARFWEFGPRTVELFRRSAILHYELFPYHYELARRAAATGAPILRPLGFAYPQDGEAWYHPDQLMIGPNVLAGMVLHPTGSQGEGDTRPHRVFLPEGRWVDLFTGAVVQGRGFITRWTSIADFPLYLKAGAAIPFNFRSPRVFAADWRPNDLDRPGRAGWLFAPQAGKKTWVRGFGGATFTARQTGRDLTIRLKPARRETAVKAYASSRPCAVLVDGKPAPRAVSEKRLTRLPRGWLFDRAKGTVVVKRVGTPGPAQIVLRSCR